MKLLAVAVVACSLAGCGGAYTIRGNKPGAGQSEFDANWLECRAMYKRMDNCCPDGNEMKTCMSSKGWTNLKVESK